MIEARCVSTVRWMPKSAAMFLLGWGEHPVPNVALSRREASDVSRRYFQLQQFAQNVRQLERRSMPAMSSSRPVGFSMKSSAPAVTRSAR